jgi:hypothetical protein
MRPGTVPHPKRRVSPEFRDRVRCAMRTTRAQVLAAQIGIPQQTGLSELLHRPFAATPLTLGRLQRLARIVGFNGELFECAEQLMAACPQ